MRTSTTLSVCALLLLGGCKKDSDRTRETFLEGEQIPGTEVFFPLAFYDAVASGPKMSPDGRLLAFRQIHGLTRAEWGIYILEVATGQKRRLVAASTARNVDWSPDGRWLAFNIGNQIHKIKANGDSLTQLTVPGGTYANSSSFEPDWSPDGSKIAWTGGIMEQDGSANKSAGTGGSPDWHPSGEKTIGFRNASSTGGWNQFPIYNVVTRSTERILDAVKGAINSDPNFSPDGRRIVYRNERGIWVMNADGSGNRRILPSHLYANPDANQITRHVKSPAWDPDGRHIVYEHFRITRFERPPPNAVTPDGTTVEGYLSIYRVDVEQALAASNLH